MTGLTVSRRQLHLLSRQTGANDWSFPFRPPQWPWRSEEQRSRAELAVRRELESAGLLVPSGDGSWQADPLLGAAAVLLGSWTRSADLVYHAPEGAVVAAVFSDGVHGVRVVGADIASDEDLQLDPADPAEPFGALLDTVPARPAGSAAPVRVPARDGAPRIDGPTTRRATEDLRIARTLIDSGVGMGRIGATVRSAPGAREQRCPRLVAFVDSSSVHIGGRYELSHGGGHATLAPASRTTLINAAHRMLVDTSVAA
ncbi:MAG: ESX secretion-associated protein EspG [Actinomycetota bacterium]|nr:ESX secretion-associated protein EspG [Actinomycetota bacterium]